MIQREGYIISNTHYTPIMFLSLNHDLLSVLRFSKWESEKIRSASQNPFHYSHSKDFPLFSEPQIISLLLQKATPLLGFKTKGQGQVGWREGGSRGQTEKKEDTQRKRGRKRAWEREGKSREKCQIEKTEKCRVVSVREWLCSQCVCMCWREIMRRAWDKTTALLCPSDGL